jgi:hypothetical protein
VPNFDDDGRCACDHCFCWPEDSCCWCDEPADPDEDEDENEDIDEEGL